MMSVKTPSRWMLVLAAALFWLAVTATAEPFVQGPPQAPVRLSPQEGDALVMRMCNECHDAKTVTARRRTRTEWEHSINDMIQEGATGSAKDFENVWAYLVQTRGRVLINDAKADEIAEVLGVTSKEAEAIVEFRAKAGRFTDLDSLRKVPGIDVKVLDTQAEAIVF
jgi:competence ComEA-like helix-hairpin-helix protein